MAIASTQEIKSSEVTEKELVELDIIVEDLGETPLAKFLTEISALLRDGEDLVIFHS